MNLFELLVEQALEDKPELESLRVVVEKELLHHDILRIMREHDLLQGLTFIGGTCLRACYGSDRLSEDLDFTGGLDFDRKTLSNLAKILVENLEDKYGLQVMISDPVKEAGNVDTWKIKIETRKQKKHLPSQRINIDICAVQSYELEMVPFLNFYDVDMGTSGLVVQAQSRQEIYTDKLLAFAFRPNRIKHRDLWDILWLHGKNIQPNLSLISLKLQDRNLTKQQFLQVFDERIDLLQNDQTLMHEFYQEMSRFLSQDQIENVMQDHGTWQAIVNLMQDLQRQIHQSFAVKK
jgi:predicted nucleotidyltransferase component of viral defense system